MEENKQMGTAQPGLADRRADPDAERSWVPVCSLAAADQSRILEHLRALPAADRYLRFGHAASDERVEAYVRTLDYQRDEVFGIINRRLQLSAFAHLAYPTEPQLATRPALVEFGVSVLPHARRRGYGRRLFEHAVTLARNRGVDRLFIHALSGNTAMLAIAREAGAKVERDGSESNAWLELAPDTIASQVEEIMEAQAGHLDYRYKRHAVRLGRLLDAAAELRRKLARFGGAALE